MLPALFAGTGAAVAWVGSWLEGNSALDPAPRWRWVAGVTAAALLLFFAFAGSWLP